MRFLVVIWMCAGSLLFAPVQSNREIVIILESGNSESIQKTLASTPDENAAGLGAATGHFLTALYQEAAPILISGPLWRSILEHKKMYDLLCGGSSAHELLRVYGSSERLGTRSAISEFQECGRYYEKLYTRMCEHAHADSQFNTALWADKTFECAHAPHVLREQSARMWHELHLYSLVSHMPLGRYQVKRILVAGYPEMPFYLFVPRSIIKKYGSDDGSLGLRVSRFSEIDPLKEKVPDIIACRPARYLNEAFGEACKVLFMPKNGKHRWCVYLMGHGTFADNSAQIDTTNASIQQCLKDRIASDQERLEWERKQADYQTKLRDFEHRAKFDEGYARINESYHQSLHSNIGVCKRNQEICDHNRRVIEENLEVLRDNIEILVYNNTIAGLNIEHFNDFLMFCENGINTRLLFYSSCSAGGKHLVDPYIDAYKQPLSLSYCVMVDALNEAPTTSVCPRMGCRWYRQGKTRYNVSYDECIDPVTKRPALICPYDLPRFFACAGQKSDVQSVRGLLESIHTKTDREDVFEQGALERGFKKVKQWCSSVKHAFFGEPPATYPRSDVSNIPSVRLPYQRHFAVIDMHDSLLSLDKNSVDVTIGSQEVVLLYDGAINQRLSFDNGSMVPSIVSMIPGRAVHEFGDMYAPHYRLSEIIAAFFSCPRLAVAKWYHIHVLTCINDLSVFGSLHGSVGCVRDVMIFNHVPLLEGEEGYRNGVVLPVGGAWYGAFWPIDTKPGDIAEVLASPLTPCDSAFIESVGEYFKDAHRTPCAPYVPSIKLSELAARLHTYSIS